MQADRKLTTIISAPTLTTDDKQAIIQELQKIAGADKGDILKNFLTTLAENNRLGVLEAVCEKFGTLMGAHRGEIDLIINSAQVGFIYLGNLLRGVGKLNDSQELDNKTISRLEKAIAKSEFSQGEKLKVIANVSIPGIFYREKVPC